MIKYYWYSTLRILQCFRYLASSIKSSTRSGRADDASRVYSLKASTTLPAQKVVLTVSKNKAQLIDLLCEDLVQNAPSFQVILTIISFIFLIYNFTL